MNNTISPREASSYPEHMITKRDLAAKLSMSERWIEYRMTEGMPHIRMGNRVRFQFANVLHWLTAQQEVGR